MAEPVSNTTTTDLPTPGEWLREQVPDAWHPSAEESFHNDRAIEGDSRQLKSTGMARMLSR